MMYTLITGASSGIGLEFAKVCASHGNDVILTARSQDQLEALSTEIQTQYKVKVQVIPLDLSAVGSATQLFEIIKGKNWDVNILINNAGFGDHGAFAQSSLKKQIEMIQLNITSLTELTHLFLSPMLNRNNGKILNVASTAAFQPGPMMSVYYATKAYVLSFSEALAEELQNTGTTITALCPGPTTSGFQKAANFSNIALLNMMTIPSSKEVAEYGYDAMMKGKVIAIHGFKNSILAKTSRFLPRSVVRKIIKKIQSKR